MYSKKAVKYYENGRVLHQQGSLLAAQKFYKKAININQNFGEAHNNLGNVLMDLAQYKEAEKSYREALHVTPDHPMILSNIGNVLQRQGKNKEAIVWLNKSISIDHSYAEAYSNLGNVLRGLKNLDEAMVSYHKAIELKPNLAEPYANMGVILNDLGRLEDALDVHNQAIKIKPNYAEAYYNRGIVLKKLGRLQEALASYNKAIQIRSDYAEAYSNRGVVLQDMGQLEEALASCDKAIQIRPDYAEAHWNLSLVSLLLGDFKNGWREYEYGKLIKKNSRRVPHGVMYKVWGGESIVNKTIFVTTEQGVGDEVFFASVIPDLIDKHPRKIILECDCRLELLFARSFPDASVRGKRTETNKAWLKEFGNIDFQIAIGSLPKYFRTKLSDFPSRKSFLVPDNDLCMMWRKRYNSLGNGIKIGISWTGGAKDTRKRANAPSLEQFIPLLSIDAYFINLQYGDHAEELAQFEKSTGIHIYDWNDVDPLTDLDNQAAQIAELDLVISFANATVHLAGALGKDVWTLVQWPPFWGWLLDRDDTVWYPSMRLFRKELNAGWDTVIDNVKTELEKRIGEK